MTYKANLNADVKMKSTRSQVVLNLMTILAGICLFVGFAFLWKNKDNAWVPLSIGLAILIPVFVAWFVAQKDTDLEQAKPTILTDAAGNKLSTDTRALMSPDGIQSLEKLFSLISHRAPLPEPDGIVDATGKPIPDTKDEAIARVAQANNEAQEITDLAAKKFGFNVSLDNAEESGTQPLLNEPYSKEIIETNITAE